ncbi:Elongation factor G [Frankliniella fusca]|uniref:Elongation factor G n=1 Tax=Frankliniella fusca TaxID=407009 RepID=A0AAE1HG39_9NEOP|nr:Elongation factor G [Frankliniella fusca]
MVSFKKGKATLPTLPTLPGVGRNAVSVALHWLKNHNKNYYDVNVDLEAIKKLPENGHFTDVVQVDVPDNEIDHANDDNENIIERVIIPGCDSPHLSGADCGRLKVRNGSV